LKGTNPDSRTGCHARIGVGQSDGVTVVAHHDKWDAFTTEGVVDAADRKGGNPLNSFLLENSRDSTGYIGHHDSPSPYSWALKLGGLYEFLFCNLRNECLNETSSSVNAGKGPLTLDWAVYRFEVESVVEIIFLEFPVLLDIDIVGNQQFLVDA
jgi:hypothetical protein